jgi:hypothetical protein
MNASLRRGAALAAVTLLLSCGGGSGGGSADPAADQALSVPAGFFGTFHGQACETADDITIVATGATARVRSYTTLQQRSGRVVGISVRFDFYDNTFCDGNPLAYLSLDDPANQAEFVGTTPVVGGLTGYKVIVSLAAPAGGTVVGGRVEFGGAVVLSAPAQLFAAQTFKDLWVYVNDVIYQGSDRLIDADGFPAYPDGAFGDIRVSSLEPMVAACAPAPVTWGGGACGATLAGGASGSTRSLSDQVVPGTGSAEFTCTAGTWMLQAGSLCVP